MKYWFFFLSYTRVVIVYFIIGFEFPTSRFAHILHWFNAYNSTDNPQIPRSNHFARMLWGFATFLPRCSTNTKQAKSRQTKTFTNTPNGSYIYPILSKPRWLSRFRVKITKIRFCFNCFVWILGFSPNHEKYFWINVTTAYSFSSTIFIRASKQFSHIWYNFISFFVTYKYRLVKRKKKFAQFRMNDNEQKKSSNPENEIHFQESKNRTIATKKIPFQLLFDSK